ncbi:BAH and coiled-coil domain-containing protein 1-like isoform X2 [Sinocyclocheilus anshuiensis]|uniref:BAH and coiled-coil domain-containing protein 1-like isoform X2 n=1 Tax=Sinocyclocheilus anshuiensis TaxID=1608454 RepID=UPI0007B8C52B|nr:PREDICTED: BAH and coiled-coil domain-containing protein 1-like isoform X2 [Sinocyclocheilus anshuiensis]
MEGRDFSAPAHLLSERATLVHRAASRISSSGHGSVQHAPHFPAGKYYPSHLPMAAHSGSGLMGNSSATFMGTFLASSLGSPASHPPHPSRPPSSPSSPPYRGGPHSSASQIWFPHSHEVPGYPRFSGSLAHTFLPISHLDHHANSGVLYGQHRFYDTQKENFYLRSIPSQPPLISANHNIQPMSRTGSGQPQGSCSRDRDAGSGMNLQKGLKEPSLERGVVSAAKDKDRPSNKHDSKDRHHHQLPHHHSHQPQLHPQHPATMEEMNGRGHKATLPIEYKEHPQSMGKPLSACLLNGKMLNGDHGTGAKGSMTTYGGDGVVRGNVGSNNVQNRHVGGGTNGHCGKEAISGEMRISEQPPTDCLERGQALQHSLPYSVPPPLPMAAGGGHPSGFHCLQLHPGHPHHPHQNRHSHHHPDFFCPPPPAPMGNPSLHDKGINNGGCRDSKVTGATFIPSVSHLGEKTGGPFQMGNSECQGVGCGGNSVKDKAMEKIGNGGHHGNWPRKQQHQPPTQQQHPYRKAEKAPDWMHNHHHHLQQQQQQQQQQSHSQQHQTVRSRSADCINSMETDMFRSTLTQETKTVHPLPNQTNTNSQPYRDCSHSGPPTIPSPLAGKTMTQHTGGGGHGSCSMQRDGQKVARIRHQQHSRAGPDTPGTDMAQANGNQEMKRKMEMSPYGYNNNVQHHPHQHTSVPPWAMQSHHIHSEENQHKAYMEPNSGAANNRPPTQQQHQTAGMGPPHPPPLHPAPPQNQQEITSSQGENSAMKNLLKYSNQQPLLLSQKSPFGGLGNLKTAANGTSCSIQGGKQTLPSRKGQSHESERADCGGRGREIGDVPHVEGEVRQPPVGIAVAVARQREPPCQASGSHPSSRQGRVHSTMKGTPRSMYPSDSTGEEERKRMSVEHMGHRCLERERDVYIRDNKERVELAHIHPSNSCHGDLTSHIMVPGGTSMQSSQLGDPAAHTHSAHHHWMPRTGSPSLWMTGHSYGIGHTALRQNLPPGFSAAMPAPLQPVLPLPQDPSTQLVVLPSEPATHPATHLDVMEQPGLWPPVYRARGAHSHMQHPAVYPRSQFLRQQELYALQQHQQLQHQQHPSHHMPPPPSHRVANNIELQQRATADHSQVQKKPEEQSMELEDILSEPRTPKPAKCYAYGPSNQASSPPRGSTAHLSPCCQSPCMRPHPKSTPSTPCPAPSPVAATPLSPAISPSPSQMPKTVESQEKRVEGQPPQDYPQSMEPDLPPGYTYPEINMGYRNIPTTQDVQLAEPADLEAVQTEPAEHPPPALSSLGEGLECHAMVRPLREPQEPTMDIDATSLVEEQPEGVFVQGEDVETVMAMGCCKPIEDNQENEHAKIICTPAEVSGCEVGQVTILSSEEVIHQEEPIVTFDEEVGEDIPPQESEDIDTLKDPIPIPQPCVSDCSLNQLPNTTAQADVAVVTEEDEEKNCVKVPSPTTHSCSQSLTTSYWSLELLIAAAFCGDCPHPSPPSPYQSQRYCGPLNSTYHGMELLSELADLELQRYQQSCGKTQEDQWTFDLQSLATLAAARALELGSQESSTTDAEKQFPARRTLNLRRKCSWTPRHEPVCPVKGTMDSMDGQELAMRVRLAELQQRYKEKQKELAKLQRKHDHQKEETPRSPARRGPGRPRKRKSVPGLGSGALNEPQKKVKLVGVGLSPLAEEHRGGGESQKKKKKLSSRGFGRLSSTQMKSQCYRKNSTLDQQITQLKQKVPGGRHSSGAASRDPEFSSASKSLYSGHSNSKRDSTQLSTANESESLSDTATSGDSGTQECWKRHDPVAVKKERKKSPGSAACLQQPGARIPQGRGQEVDEDGETSPSESESSEQEEDEEEGSYGSEDGQDIKAQTFRDLPFSPAITGPSTFSVVKLEANQKAKIKRERQELYGSQFWAITDGDVKVKRRPTCRSVPITVSKPPGVRRRPGRPRLQDKRCPGITGRPGHYRKSSSLLSFPSSSNTERLKRATRKSSMLRATRRTYWSTEAQSQDSDDNGSTRRTRLRESKGRAVSRLMESFAADEGFHLGEDSSFSEEDERKVSSNSRSAPAPPNCVLTKELLTDGLKVLISKEDELLYAARVQPLETPDVYSIVIDGERGNRPRIYSLEQLLQEAVLDVRPETEAVLKEGTRVCAYWSERSRCLYPGYVRRGGDESKPGGVMVEFDDGDRGWISLSNIRFLPPGYQIQCADLSPGLISEGQLDKNSSMQENKTLSERTARTDRFKVQEKLVRRPGRPKGSGLKKSLSDSVAKSSAPAVAWPSVAAPRKRMPVNFFPLSGSASKKALKGRVAETSSRPSVSMTTPTKGLFSSSSFEVDSFSSIANGYSSFGSQTSGISLEGKNSSYSQKKRIEEPAQPRGKKAEFLIKLDHEGVTSPKTKNSKALLLLGASGFGSNGVGGLPRAEAYSHPVLLVKDNRKGDGSRAELLLKGTAVQRKPSPSLRMSEYGDLNLGCHRDCHSSYSDMDEEEEEVERRTGRAALAPASGGLRTAGRFLSHISVSSSSSGSSSSSSSGSLSSSSLCSSENDSSYSSEDEESCLTPHHSLLQTPEPPVGPPRHSFVAKAVAVSNAKGGHGNHNTNSKPQKRKEYPSSLSRTPKDLVKRQRLLAVQTKPRVSTILSSRQLWRWSGNPTQRRGLKGKARKLFYKAIVCGKDMVRLGDCAVFLSTGQPHLPLIGRIESFWESWQSSMVVKVQWFYHPEETKLGKRHRDGKEHALYQSCHEDENDVQTISHKCQVVTREEYEQLTRNRKSDGSYHDLYYLAGTYDPTSGQLLTADGMSILC